MTVRSPWRVVAVLSLLAAAIVYAQVQVPTMGASQTASLTGAKWAPAKPPLPPTMMVSPVASDPGGGAVGYTKYPPGAGIPEHWHSASEYSTVLAGNMKLKLDGKTYDLAPGSYWVAPPRTPHQTTCVGPAECITFSRRAGPLDYNFVK